MDDHLDIEAHLAYSEKLHGLAAGHQQETNQLLEDIELLQADLRRLLAENQTLRATNETKDARIEELKQRVADLQKTTFQVNGDYIEEFHVDKYLAAKPKSKTKTKFKVIDLSNQLPLWTNQEPSM